MANWKVFEGATHRQGCLSVEDVTRISGNGYLIISADIYERLGKPPYIEVLMDGDASKLGIRRAERSPVARKLYRYHARDPRGHMQTMIAGALKAQNRTNRGMRTVPHEWDGDVLVIDTSSVPLRGAP